MEQAAVLLAVSGELYAALPAPTIPVLHKQKVSRAGLSQKAPACLPARLLTCKSARLLACLCSAARPGGESTNH